MAVVLVQPHCCPCCRPWLGWGPCPLAYCSLPTPHPACTHAALYSYLCLLSLLAVPACRRMPVLKRVLDLPAFKAVINKVAPAGGGLPV